MKVVVTCGPSSIPIDEVRRITNHATGEIGTLLAEAAAEKGFEVICCRGHGATYRPPGNGVETHRFTTNSDLETLLQRQAGGAIRAIFHAAALSDFELVPTSSAPVARKISSRAGGFSLQLVPAPKLLTSFRDLFPDSNLIGWKYELDGGLENVRAAGERQLRESRSDAVVLNGAAYGPGFGLLLPDGELLHSPTKQDLVQVLTERHLS